MSGRICCVVGCSNSKRKDPRIVLYNFPWKSYEKERLKRWITAIRRVRSDGRPWQPSRKTAVCCKHFVSGKKSPDQSNVDYVPTIFPDCYRKRFRNTTAILNRAKRHESRVVHVDIVVPSSTDENNESAMILDEQEPDTKSIGTQYRNSVADDQFIFVCERAMGNEVGCQAQVECMFVKPTRDQATYIDAAEESMPTSFLDCKGFIINVDVPIKEELDVSGTVRVKQEEVSDGEEKAGPSLGTSEGGGPHYCQICDQFLATKQSLQVHNRIHTGGKTYQCALCDKFFTKKHSLEVHNRTHTGDKPYQCTICDKFFTTKYSRKIHNRTHTGEKPYQCQVCDKFLTTKQSLEIHNRTHTGGKPYQCTPCDKFFTTKHSLKIHCRNHTAEKPYHCQLCVEFLTSKQSLEIHSRTHTGKKPCRLCDKFLTTKLSLESHHRKHTGKKPY